MAAEEQVVPRHVENPWGYEIWWAVTDQYVGKIFTSSKAAPRPMAG